MSLREESTYIRMLELISLITEDWGDTVKGINRYMNHGWKEEDVRRAIEEITKIQSPLKELESLLELKERQEKMK